MWSALIVSHFVAVFLAQANADVHQTVLRLKECRNGTSLCVETAHCNIQNIPNPTDTCPTDKGVCCPKESVIIPIENIEIVSSTLTLRTPNRNDSQAEEPNSNEENLPTSPPINTLIQCGQRSMDRWDITELTGKLDDRAEYDEIPWMVAIFQMPISDHGPPHLMHCCNGALIGERAVLTTAYCLDNCGGKADRLLARLGDWDLYTSNEPIQQKDVPGRIGHIHPDFSDYSLINNIAVLELASVVEYGPTIQAVCLPEDNYTIGNQDDLIFSGWGETVKNTGPHNGHNFLKKVLLRRSVWDICQEEIAPYDPSRRINHHKSLVCATGQHKEIPCREDVAAPVVAKVPDSEDRYYLHGLVSWGFHCRQKNRTSTALTTVQLFREWIDRTLTLIDSTAT